MSSRNDFFDKVNKQNEAEKEARNAFNNELKEFQVKTQQLINDIQSWFEGSSITSTISQREISESIDPTVVNRVQSLTLKNGEKTLTIEPEGLRFFGGISGALRVKIINMSRAPNSQTFSLHMYDRAPRAKGVTDSYEGWVIVTSCNEGRVVEAFNEENFFAQIESFA